MKFTYSLFFFDPFLIPRRVGCPLQKAKSTHLTTDTLMTRPTLSISDPFYFRAHFWPASSKLNYWQILHVVSGGQRGYTRVIIRSLRQYLK